jgi:hypothetical protein
MVIDQCNLLHGEWCVERRGSGQRHLERHAERQWDCKLRARLHRGGRDCERHSDFERGGESAGTAPVSLALPQVEMESNRMSMREVMRGLIQ